MKLSIEQHQLQSILARVTGAVSKRNTIPILGNVKLSATEGHLTAVATDLDLEVTARQPAQVQAQGITTANAALLQGIVNKLPKGALVDLEEDGDYLHIKSGKSKFKLATLPAEDFPQMASNEYQSRLEFDAESLKSALDKTIWSVSSEETRYYLNGVLMQRVDGRATFTSTDGHRLSHYKANEADEFPDVIIPSSAVKQFSGALVDGEAIVEVSATKIRLTHGDVVIVSKVIDGTYPDWTRVVPKSHTNKITMSSVDARAAIDRVITVATDRVRAVRFAIGEDELTLSVSDSTGGSGVEVVEVEQSGELVNIGFNSKYTLDAFAQADKGDVTVYYSDAMSPALVEYEKEPELLVVLMPIRM